MNKNKKYILIALLASLLFTVAIGFSMWIILSEQTRGYIQSMGTLELKPNGPLYAGETWTYEDGKEGSPNYATVTYKHYTSESAEAVSEALSGTFVVSKTETSGGSEEVAANVKVTFFPSNPFIQWVWGEKIEFDENVSVDARPHAISGDIKLKAVAKYGNNYYTTIDAAFSAAKSATSGAVYAIPSSYAIESGRAVSAKTICNPVTVPSGVTFSLSYDVNNKFPNTSKTPDNDDYFAATQSVINAYNDETKCTNIVTLSNTMTVNGSLCVYGSCISGQGGYFAGNVHGNYGKLIFDKDSELASITVNSGGKAYIYGFVESHETEYSKFVFQSESELQIPFTIYEWRGGTINLPLSKTDIVPFLRFALASIAGTYRVMSGANVIGKTSVTVSRMQISDDVTLISSSSSAFLQMPTSGGQIDISYSPKPLNGKPLDEKYGKSEWKMSGGGTMHPISISKSVLIASVDITTKDKYLPLTYLLDIKLLDGKYDLTDQDIKLLPGASVTVGRGAEAEMNKLILYSQIPILGEACTHTEYPNLGESQLNILDGGKLIVQGGIGGAIPAVAAGGTLQIADNAEVTATSPEFDNDDSGIVPKYYNEDLSLPKHSDASDNYTDVGTYYTAPREDGTFGWYLPTITVGLNANGGTLSGGDSHTVTTTVPGAGLVLSELDKDKTIAPTLAYHTFSHWCTDANCDIEHCSRPASIYDGTGVTLYATWIQNQYTIRYRISDNGSTVGEFVTLKTFTSDEQATFSVTLPSAAEIESKLTSNSKFIRWNSNASNTGTVIDPETATFADYIALATVDEKGQGTITIYAYCASAQCDLTLVVGNGKDNIEISGVSPTYNPNLENDTIKDYLDKYNENFAQSMYLEGWYADAECATPIDFSNGFPYDPVTFEAKIYAKWVPKTYILTLNPEAAVNNVHHAVEGKSIYFNATQMSADLLAEFSENASKAKGSDSTITVQNYFGGWNISLADARNSAKYTTDYTENGYTFKQQTFSANWTPKYVITYNANSGTGSPDQMYCRPGEAVTLPTPTRSNHTFNGWYTAASGGTKVGSENESYTPEKNITLYAQWTKESSGTGCVAPGTLITLADGTQKKVEDLTMDDLLLVFNHETGRYEAAAITFIENDGWDYYDVINLVFSDGTVTKLIYEHALFDLTLNKYVYITEQNYADFVGHEFAVQDGDTFGRVTLTEAFVEREYTGCYSLVTAYHLNYLIDGLFSIPGGIDGLFNIFEYGDDLKYDEEKMNADIHEFGLFTYEEFASYYPEIPVEVYEMFPAKYFKVSIGKGMLTFEDISSYIEQFLIKNGII